MRYIGNKTKLLLEIDKLLEKKGLKKQGLIFCDLFCGTATVSNFYNGYYKIVANDILDFSRDMAYGLLMSNDLKFENLGFDPFEYFENSNTNDYNNGFCYNTFSPKAKRQYFSEENAKYIDFIRDKIDEWYNSSIISLSEKRYLIMCLIEAVSKVSNVAGVYSAFLKIWDPRAIKKMKYEKIDVKDTPYVNSVYCSDSNILINKINGDILYIDPPYTPTQYNSQYHVLETISRNDSPSVHGIGAHRDNDRLSKWCKKGSVEFAFEELIHKANFKHIVFSYSDKGLMSLDFIESVLKRYAKPNTYEFKKIDFVKYKNTRSVNRERLNGTEKKKHYEYLFYIEKAENPKFISPLNYIGGKYDVVDLIKDNLPQNYNKVYDLFGGGSTVGINISHSIIYNDINEYVSSLLKFLSDTPPDVIYKDINRIIKKYGLQKSDKVAYNKLREAYNANKNNLYLYLLICYGFEHQIRFNSKHMFNNPCGNSGFNDKMYEKLISYYLVCNDLNIEFNSGSYEKYFDKIGINDFVYLDPPYLNNNGAYQDGKRGFNGWDEQQENELLKFIEKLNKSKIRFMLSNYLNHSNVRNDSLISWACKNSFRVVVNDKLTKRNRQNRTEILVMNYDN